MRLEIEIHYSDSYMDYNATVVGAEGFGSENLVGISVYGETQNSALRKLTDEITRPNIYNQDDIKRWNETCMDWAHIRQQYQPTKDLTLEGVSA